MTTTDRAPLDLTEQAIKWIRHSLEHTYGRPIIVPVDDARLLLAEIERLRAMVPTDANPYYSEASKGAVTTLADTAPYENTVGRDNAR